MKKLVGYRVIGHGAALKKKLRVELGRHLGRPVGIARWAPLTTDGTFGPQVDPQLMQGDFAATPWNEHSHGNDQNQE